MTRQIQLRRGTATQNNDFTGATGEITMDTTNNTLRVHDGITAGGIPLAKQASLDAADYVIEIQQPSPDNDYTWYRKYKSGWVEQGGHGNGTNTITFPIPFANNAYSLVTGFANTSNGDNINYARNAEAINKTPTGFNCIKTWTSSGTSSRQLLWSNEIYWVAFGMCI